MEFNNKSSLKCDYCCHKPVCSLQSLYKNLHETISCSVDATNQQIVESGQFGENSLFFVDIRCQSFLSNNQVAR